MRWAEDHLNPILALRNLVCNGAWEAGWRQIELFTHEQQLCRRLQRAEAKQPSPPAPLSLATASVADPPPESDSSDEPPPTRRSRPSPDHPWRNNQWPSYEDRYWN